jgi:hypothetical protein
MNDSNLEITKDAAYAISFLDNGGDPENFPKTHKKLYSAIKKEEKRRLMVEIRYLINKTPTFKRKMYKIIGENEKSILNPHVLYKLLDGLTYNQLKKHLHE